MRSSMNAALTGGLLLLAGATGAMASGRGSGYVIDSPYAVSPALTVLSALAAAPVGYVVGPRCVRQRFVDVDGTVVSRRICYPAQIW